jgi:hypothetical protein
MGLPEEGSTGCLANGGVMAAVEHSKYTSHNSGIGNGVT